MRTLHRRGGGVISATFVVGLMLSMLPLPDWAEPYRPEWVAMILIYWCLALPDRIGVGVGWVMGLFLDVVRGAILGQHALALALTAYLALHLHQRVRLYPIWQQALTVLMLVAFAQMLVLWIKGIIGQSPQSWWYWVPSLTSMLLWPWVFLILRDVRRKFQVN